MNHLIWNESPAAIKESNTLDTFKCRLKTHLASLTTHILQPPQPARRLPVPKIRLIHRPLRALQIFILIDRLIDWIHEYPTELMEAWTDGWTLDRLTNSDATKFKSESEGFHQFFHKSKIWDSGLPAARSEISGPNFEKISGQFQDTFVGITKLKTQKMHVFLCSLKQISIVVLKMLLRQCYTYNNTMSQEKTLLDTR